MNELAAFLGGLIAVAAFAGVIVYLIRKADAQVAAKKAAKAQK
jgi:flagellar biogenesis protein FliO